MKGRMDISVILTLLALTGLAHAESKEGSVPSSSCDLSDLYGMASSCETDFICQNHHLDCSVRYETLLYCVTGIVWNCFRGMMSDDELVDKAVAVQMMFKTSRGEDAYCSGRIWTHLDVGQYLAENDGVCTPAFYDEKEVCFSSVSPALNNGNFFDPHLCSDYGAALVCTREVMRQNCRFSGKTQDLVNITLGQNPFCSCQDASSTTVRSDSQQPTKQSTLPTDATVVMSTDTLNDKTTTLQSFEPFFHKEVHSVQGLDMHFARSTGQNVSSLSKVCSIMMILVTMLLVNIN